MQTKPNTKPRLKDTDERIEPLDLQPLHFIVYIDGYNLYSAIAHGEPPNLLRLGWCNYQKLGERLVGLSFQNTMTARVVTVKYFTAPVESGFELFPGEKARQDLWLDALKKEAPDVAIIAGAHARRQGERREKMTDVNIGITIASDLTQIRPAGMVLVSGDRDFQPAVELVAQQGTPVAVFFPQDHARYNFRLGAEFSKRVMRAYLTREIMEPCRLKDPRWRDYLEQKVNNRKNFKPCLDYEDSLSTTKPEQTKNRSR
jgi:hypothetical protein